jgi:Acyl-CoA carboxylase epsilon subunit
MTDDPNAAAAPTPDGSTRPVLRIVRGNPTPEDLAALTAIVSASGGDDDGGAPPTPVRGRWNDPAHRVRPPLSPGPGGWRATR